MKSLYYSYSQFLKRVFNKRVYKIPLNINSNCPNRDGTYSYKGCLYCSSKGSGTGSNLSVIEQIDNFIKNRKKEYGYIGYLQSFSNMYGDYDKLIKLYLQILNHNNIIGISIATRPDTVNKDILRAIKNIRTNKFIQIELGLESANNKTLEFLNRHEQKDNFINACNLIKSILPNAHIVGHIIIGLPNENMNDYINSVNTIIKYAHGIKIHHLYIEKDMPIKYMFFNNEITLLGEYEYIEILHTLLKIINNCLVIHRLKSISNYNKLIAPLWTNDKYFYIKLKRYLYIKGT